MIVTKEHIFSYCNIDEVTQGLISSKIDELIVRGESFIESYIGRKIQSTATGDVILQDGINCEIIGQKMYLKGSLRDLYSISSFTEFGTALEESQEYGDNLDYILDAGVGIITRINRSWSSNQMAYKICGLVNLSRRLEPSDGIMQCVIDWVSIKAMTLDQFIESDSGQVSIVRTKELKKLNMDDLYKMLDTYKLREI